MNRKSANVTRALMMLLFLLNGTTSISVHAHPIEYHMHPLDATTVERVIRSLGDLASEMKASGFLDQIQQEGSDLDSPMLLLSIQGALMGSVDTKKVDGDVINLTLSSAGYTDSPYKVEEFLTETEQVLETYEVLKRGLDLQQVYAGYAALERDRENMDEETAVERESVLVRNHELVRTTGKDQELLRHYIDRLDALMALLGLSGLQ